MDMHYVTGAVDAVALEPYDTSLKESYTLHIPSAQETILVNLASLEAHTFSNDMGETYRMRLWEADDADGLAEVYNNVYSNQEHCDKTIFEAERFQKDHKTMSFYGSDYLAKGSGRVPNFDLWFVVEKETAPGEYAEMVGSFAINVHSDDLSGEMARFAIKKEYQGSHIGGKAIAQLDVYAEELGLEKTFADATSPISFKALLRQGYAPEGVNVGEFVEKIETGEGHKRLNSMRVAKLTPKGLSKVDVDISDFQFSLIVAGAEFEESVRESVGLEGLGMHGDIIHEFSTRNRDLVDRAVNNTPHVRSYVERMLAQQ